MAGVTTARDLGTEGAGYADVGLKRAIDLGIIPGPRLIITTRAIVATGSYNPRGAPEFTLPKGAEPADGHDDLIKVTRDQIGRGADWIKDLRRLPLGAERHRPTHFHRRGTGARGGCGREFGSIGGGPRRNHRGDVACRARRREDNRARRWRRHRGLRIDGGSGRCPLPDVGSRRRHCAIRRLAQGGRSRNRDASGESAPVSSSLSNTEFRSALVETLGCIPTAKTCASWS